MKTPITLAIVSALFIQTVGAAIVFSDDFESNSLANWTVTSQMAPSGLEVSPERNVEPVGGSISAKMDTSADRMHHNLFEESGGLEVFEHATFTSWIYDSSASSTATRIFNEVRSYSGTGIPNGDTMPDGTLSQVLAIGKYNNVTLSGEVFDATKYQARIAFGGTSGWFNLNDHGAPSRAEGWHRFDIEMLPEEATVRFYVDSILARTFVGANLAPWDTVILGPGLGTTAGEAWIDGITINHGAPLIPEPATVGMLLFAAVAAARCSRRI